MAVIYTRWQRGHLHTMAIDLGLRLVVLHLCSPYLEALVPIAFQLVV